MEVDPAMLTPEYCALNSSGVALVVVSAITFALATLLVFLRVYTRIALVKAFWWDDVCLIIGYLISVAGCILQWKQVELGLGRHMACSSLEDNLNRGHLEWIATTVLGFSVIFTRTSVALFIIRLFGTKHIMRVIIYMYTAFMNISLAVTLILLWFICDPIAALWNFELLETATCWSPTASKFLDNYNGAVSILSDAVLALLPVYFISTLKMKLSVKIGIATLMAVGLLTAACAMARTILTPKMDESDPAYSGVILLVFGTLEMEVGLIAAAIPGLPPLFRKDKTGQSTTGRSGRSHYYNRDTLCCGWNPFSSSSYRSQNKPTRLTDYNIEDSRRHSGGEHSLTTLKERQAEQGAATPKQGIAVTRRVDVEYA